jgi:flagellar basal-body rod modification protein FlgD
MEVGATDSNPIQMTNKFAQLDSSEFVNVLITELQNQDPFNPQDTSALLEQLSSLRNIESQTMLGDRLNELVTQNQVAAAGNLIGKMVEGIDTTHTRSTGLVTSVRVTDDGVYPELDTGRTLSLDQLIGIADVDADTAAAESAAGR